MNRQIVAILFLLVSITAYGQDKEKLFGGSEKKEPKKGFILQGNVSVDLPGGDMAKRFGNSSRIGPGVIYKTSTNWLIGVKFDFIVGSDIREDSVMVNITDRYSPKTGGVYEFIDKNGQRVGVPVYERGYAVGVEVGKIINLNKKSVDNGLCLLTTVGFMQHKLNIFDQNKAVDQIRDELLKGYDRLTNGVFAEQYVGYIYFSKNKLINVTIGLDALFGFTQGRRDYLYDVARPDNKQRLDILYGIRGGIMIPIFKRKSEDLLFE